jgi:Lipocalin-like domain
MNLLKSFGLIAFCLLAFTTLSCKKEVIVTKEVDIETQLLGRWKITSVVMGGKEVLPTFFDMCDLDNTLVFEASGKGNSDFGTIKCTASEPQTKSFSWVWKDKVAKKFSINDGDITELTIIEINNTTMKADFVDVIAGTFTFTRQ